MASIVAQQQDLFFDFGNVASGQSRTVEVAESKNAIFLIGCFRKDQRDHIEHVLKDSCCDERCVLRLGKGQDGWMNKDNPRIANPDYAVLYELGGDEVIYSFMVEDSSVSPEGNLIYRLSGRCSIKGVDFGKVLNNYRERTNWEDGKPVYMSGKELLSVESPKVGRGRRNAVETEVGADGLPSLQDVIDGVDRNVIYEGDALTSIDLFSGCGGLTKGFSMAGIRSIFASDIDENCEKTFKRNFPDVPFLCKDITQVTKEEVDALTGGAVPDMIIGGPPCQGFSLANKRRNQVADDPRNRLFYSFVKFINWYSPKVFVMENVKGLLSMKDGEVFKTILDAFRNAGGHGGYDVAYKVMLASDFGVPQNRERVIIIGTRRDLGLQPRHPEPFNLDHKVTVDEAISDLPQIEACQGAEVMAYPVAPQNEYQALMRTKMTYVTNHVAMRHTPRLVERFKAIRQGQSLVDVWETHGSVKRGAPGEKSDVKFGQNNQRLFGNLPAPTIAASFQSNFIHPHLNRNFTAREGARLQSFPDDFIFEGMRTKMSWEKGLSQYQQIGNAVPVLMAKAIGECIIEILNN